MAGYNIRGKRWLGVCLILFFMAALLPVAAYGENPEKVVDQAELFTAAEREEIQALCESAVAETNMDVVVVTTGDANGKSAMEFADDYFDYNGYGVGGDHSGILFLIDMDNREIWISTTGLAIRYFTDARIDRMLDVVFGDVADGDYAAAARAFVGRVTYYAKLGIPDDQYNYDPGTGEKDPYIPVAGKNFWSELGTGALAAFAVALVAALIAWVCAKRANGKQVTARPATYLTPGSFRLTAKSDLFLRESVQRRYIEPPSSSSSGGGGGGSSSTHSGSSGTTHGGGGRSF